MIFSRNDPSTKRERVTRLMTSRSLADASCPVLLLVFIAVLVGCKGPGSFDTSDGSNTPIKPADIPYATLAERYNKTVEAVPALWARTDVEVEWYELDSDGDRRFRSESGGGKFMLRRPSDTALLVEKLGKIYLWAGSDSERYWLFDRVPGSGDTAYLGEFSKLGRPGTRRFPLPVRPDLVPLLLGLLPMPSEAFFDEPPPIDLYQGQYLVDLSPLSIRMLIDPQTFRPTRVDLTDRAGYSVLTAKLKGAFPVEVEGKDEADWPTICEAAEIYVSGVQTRLTVGVDYATTDTARLRDAAFSFESISKSLKPETVVPLDAD